MSFHETRLVFNWFGVYLNDSFLICSDCRLSQDDNVLEVIHLREGFVIPARTHQRLLGLIRRMIYAIDGKINEEEPAADTGRKIRPPTKRSVIEKCKQELVQLFVTAIFPGPTADVIAIRQNCYFTNER